MTKIITAVVICLLICQACAGQENWEPLTPAMRYEVRCHRIMKAKTLSRLEEKLKKASDQEEAKQLEAEINRILFSIKMQREEDYWAEVVKKQAELGRVWVQPAHWTDDKPSVGYWKETKGLTAAQEKEAKRAREEMPRLLKRERDPRVIQSQEKALQMPDLQYWNYLVEQQARHGVRWQEWSVDPDGKCEEGHWEPVQR